MSARVAGGDAQGRRGERAADRRFLTDFSAETLVATISSWQRYAATVPEPKSAR
jgi:hypothetical protein